MGIHCKIFIGFIESDVSIGTKTQKLQINTSQIFNHLIITGTLCFCIRIGSAGYIGIGLIDVDMIKEITPHKMNITLIIVLPQTHVFIQIDGTYL